VERHLSNVLGKLGVSSRSQAVDRAREVGALPPEGNGDPDPSKA
jgi:ATP/maltotriose-dependent transcriptional regulator MalT